MTNSLEKELAVAYT